jgi:hypothetical protein
MAPRFVYLRRNEQERRVLGSLKNGFYEPLQGGPERGYHLPMILRDAAKWDAILFRIGIELVECGKHIRNCSVAVRTTS